MSSTRCAVSITNSKLCVETSTAACAAALRLIQSASHCLAGNPSRRSVHPTGTPRLLAAPRRPEPRAASVPSTTDRSPGGQRFHMNSRQGLHHFVTQCPLADLHAPGSELQMFRNGQHRIQMRLIWDERDQLKRLGGAGLIPPIRISPLSGWNIPAMQRIVVVLPAPLGPSSATTSPFLTPKDKPCTPSPLRYFFTRSLTDTISTALHSPIF